MFKQAQVWLLAGALLSGVAQAQVTGTVTMKNFTFELTDLDPNDGVAAALTWEASPFSHQATSYAYIAGDISGWTYYGGDSQSGSAPLEPLSVNASLPRGGGWAKVSGELGRDLTLQASITTAREAAGETEPVRWQAYASTGWIPFTLSPNTSVTFRTDVHVEGPHAGEGYATWNAIGVRTNLAGAWDEVGDHVMYGSSTSLPQPFDEQLEISVSNLFNHATTNVVLVTGDITGLNSTSPVPEPSTWMMLLAGLGLAGAARKRLQ